MGVSVAVGVWVAVGEALGDGVVEGVSVTGGLVAWAVPFPVPCSSCESSGVDPVQADISDTRIRNNNHKERDLIIIRMLVTSKSCRHEI